MRKLFEIMGVALFCVSMNACSSSKKTIVQEIQLPPITISLASPINEYRTTPARIWDITHTDILLKDFDLIRKTVRGKAIIKLHPYAAAQSALVLDAKSMKVESVQRKNAGGPVDYRQEDDSLIIRFGQNFAPKDTIEIAIDYVAMPYENPTGGSKAISDDRGLYFINTDNAIANKPAQIWTQGETESNAHWFPTIDKPNERFTFSLSLTVPDSFITLSNGFKKSSEKAGSGLRRDVWVMDQPIQTYAVMFAIGKFSVVEDFPALGKPVNYYVEPAYAPYAKKMFLNTPEMIEYFSRITGVPYPWNKYSQVVVRDYVSGAMENTSASLFGEFMNQNNRQLQDKNNEDVVSHELFHQWFGDYVTAESWSNLTVNESFATYGEQLWRKHKHGTDYANELATQDLFKYLFSSENNDPPLVRYHYDSREDMFDRVSYQKGAAILRYMHGMMGDTAFFRAMKIYLTNNALQPAEASDWRKAVEESTGEDWHPFFDQWYYRGGHPKLAVSYQYDDANATLSVTTKQLQPDSSYAYALPLKGLMLFDDDSTFVDWNVEKRTSTQKFSYYKKKRPVFIPDVYHWLPGTIEEKGKTPEQWFTQFLRAPDNANRRQAMGYVNRSNNDSLFKEMLKFAFKDRQTNIRQRGIVFLLMRRDTKLKETFKNEIASLAKFDADNQLRALGFELLGKWKVESSKEQMLEAINDSSYLVAGEALSQLFKMDSTLATEKAHRFLNTNPQGALYHAVWEILANAGNPNDLNAFKTEALKASGTDKIGFANYLAEYATRTNDPLAFNEALQTITEMANHENLKGYRFAIGAGIWEMANDYRKDTRSKNEQKAALAKARLIKLGAVKDQILNAETDLENQQEYRNLEKE